MNKDIIARDLREKLKEKLKNFPLYKDSHYIQVVIKKHIYIGYSPNDNRIENISGTRFDIEIGPKICYILDFNIEKNERRKGYGSLLVSIIENFCSEEISCKRFITTPSGLAKEYGFWEKQGFKYRDGLVAEKWV